MNPTAKSMIIRAQDSLDNAKKFLEDDNQHDAAGYNLAQASEHFMKALIAMFDLEIPKESSHDLDALMETLEEGNFSAISSHADLLDLEPYNSPQARVKANERLDLKEYCQKVEDLKELVRQQSL